MLNELRNKIILFFFPNFFDNFYQSMDYVYSAFKFFLLFIFLLYMYFKRNYFYEYLNKKNILSKSILSNTITRVCLGFLALYNFIRLYNPDSRYTRLELNYFPKVIYQNIPPNYINSIDLLTISTHSFDKESYSPFELEQLTEHLLNKQREGYKQIVVNLKNGEKVTSGFCYSDFFRDC